MATFFTIAAIVVAALWMVFFTMHFIIIIEDKIAKNMRYVYSTKKRRYYKILGWKSFWYVIIRSTRKGWQFLFLITGAPVWGFILYMIIESLIIVGKRIYYWL